MKKFDPANNMQDLRFSKEFAGINPAITDSSTYTFKSGEEMSKTFEGETEGLYLYSRHTTPNNSNLSATLAALENTEAAQVTASGMGAITSTLLQICGSGDEIVSSRTIYGGTYAFMKNFLPKLGIKTHFVDTTNIDAIEEAINENTKLIYCESMSNPLLEITNLPEVSKLAKTQGVKLVVDNTFSPMIISPANLGADVVIHSLTKFINGASDTVGGVICSTQEFINSLIDVNDGACMLLGPTMDSFRAAGILKNMQTLPLRMKQHSKNAQYLAERLEKDGLRVIYPGLASHNGNSLMQEIYNEEYGFGGMMGLDLGTLENANKMMGFMQNEKVGFLAVSLGYYHTLFSASGASTSSEIPEDEQKEMGLSEGLIRFSMGLDNDIERTYQIIKGCLDRTGILKTEMA